MRCRSPVDEVGVSGTAAARAYRQPTGELSLGCRGERGRLLVPDVDPVDTTLRRSARATDGVDDRVERVADDAVDAFHPRLDELVEELRTGESRGGEARVRRCRSRWQTGA